MPKRKSVSCWVTEAEVVYVAVDANRRKMKINREAVKNLESIEQHETS